LAGQLNTAVGPITEILGSDWPFQWIKREELICALLFALLCGEVNLFKLFLFRLLFSFDFTSDLDRFTNFDSILLIYSAAIIEYNVIIFWMSHFGQ